MSTGAETLTLAKAFCGSGEDEEAALQPLWRLRTCGPADAAGIQWHLFQWENFLFRRRMWEKQVRLHRNCDRRQSG